MADRQLRLLVGAAIDASFGQVMSSVVEAAKRARRQIAAEMVAGAREGAKAAKEGAAEQVTAIKSTVTVAKTAKQQADAMAADVLRVAKANAREKVALEKAAMREVEQDLRQHAQRRKQIAKDLADSEGKASNRGGGGGLSRGGALLIRGAAAAAGAGARMLGSMVHGMGVDTSIGSQISSATHREALATDVASQGYIGSGKGPKGSQTYTPPSEIMEQARSVGTATATDTGDILEGLNKFVKMTGDLKTARESMSDIGKIAKANGADFGEMMEAAANVSIAMGDVDNKGPALASVMRTIAGQGHLGAVAISDMAKQMGKLTAQANFFKIDPMSAKTLSNAGVTDQVGQRVAVMGAMAQWARAKGGRITAGQATQSSMAMIRDLANPTEVKRMAAMGISTYTDAGHTIVRDPLQMFLEASKKARAVGGLNRDVLNKIFPNIQSRATVNAMSQDYDKAYTDSKATTEQGKHQDAMESLTATFQNYLAVTQSGAEVQMKFNAAMQTTESQSKILNNEIGKVAEELSKALLPAVIALAPSIIGAIGTISEWIAKVTGKTAEVDDKKNREADIKGVNAMSLAERIANEGSAPRAKHFNFLTQSMTEDPSDTKITTIQEKEMADAKKNLQEAIERKGKEVAEEGTHVGSTSSDGSTYASYTDKELSASVAAGDIQAQKYQQDLRQQAEMKNTLDRLTTAMDKIGALKDFGRVTEVAIVSDATKPPPGAAVPATSGVQAVNSSQE